VENSKFWLTRGSWKCLDRAKRRLSHFFV
jgi:hypothetical protein